MSDLKFLIACSSLSIITIGSGLIIRDIAINTKVNTKYKDRNEPINPE